MADILVWLIALPLSGAVATLLFPRRGYAIAIGSAVATAVAAGVLVHALSVQGALHYAMGGWHAGLGIALRADGLSGLLILMTALVMLAGSSYAGSYFRRAGQRRHLWPLWLMLWASLNALLLAGDLFNLYVTLELLGLSAVSLQALETTRQQ